MHKSKKLMATILAFAMILSAISGFFPLGKAYAAQADGVEDEFVISNPRPSDESTSVVEKEGNKLRRLVSGSGNNNGDNPAVFIDKTAGKPGDGVYEFKVTPNSDGAETRFGVYLRYQSLEKTIFVGFDREGWFWQLYNGQGNPWFSGTRKAYPNTGETQNVRIELKADKMTVTVNGEDAFGGPVDVSSISENGAFGFKASTYGSNRTDVNLGEIHYPGQAEVPEAKLFTLTGLVTDTAKKPLEGVDVKVDGKTAKTNSEGRFSLAELVQGDKRLTLVKDGYISKSVDYTFDENNKNIEVSLEKEPESAYASLSNDDMTVRLDAAFPRVRDYTMHKEGDKVLYGQKNKIETLRINGRDTVPSVKFNKISASEAEYVLEGEKVDAIKSNDSAIAQPGSPKYRITLRVKLEKNTLEMKFTKIESLNASKETDDDIVRTIEIPNHALVSVYSTDEGANYAGGRVVVNTRSKDGDVRFNLNASTRTGSWANTISVISNKDLSATIYTNTETDAWGDWNNTVYTVYDAAGGKKVSLSSAEWVYQKGLQYREQKDESLGELPVVRVAIVGDANKDGKVNWNDGAIAHRSIQKHRYGSEMVPDTVAIRIAMNFGSQAQNPFLVTLDNVKKIALHTDGLGQNVLLKGYGSEGHDSGHLNYADIGRRIGGAQDMKTLLAEGEKYGAIFGIHVNASETYPESKYFEPDRLRKTANGEYSFGWNWIDQGININADYDLRHGRAQRFKDLATALDKGDGTNDLDYIYVDVWGNGQSGDNANWASKQLAKEIMSNKWAVAGEWGYANAYDSIFQHWAADINYGGYSLKGINSKLIRFIQNHERDSWVADVPSYSGAAMNPLLGGYNMKDFEGWQGRNNYASYIKNLYRIDLASKFVQHFKVTEWEDGKATNLPSASNWIPEMRLALMNDDLGKKLEITRGANDYNKDSNGYRSRTFNLDGVTVLKENSTDVSYLLPWYWNANGGKLKADDMKLYHYNTRGGQTSWTLPKDFSGLSNVYVYELTDTGKTNKKVVPVVNNEVTLDAKAETPYVVFKGEKANMNVEWSRHAHLTDTGFNSRKLDHWMIEGKDSADKVEVVDTASGTQVLEINNNKKQVKLTQKLVDLKPGQRYAVYVGVENRSDTKAFIELTDASGKRIDYNYTNRSIALNFIKAYAHNTNNESYTVDEANPYSYRLRGTSYFQNMYVFFTAPRDGSDVKLTIGKEAGEGLTYFDDIRVFETKMNTYPENNKVFFQDFEDTTQGIYPFVIGGSEGIEDNRIHLSEKHAPYTQRGWHIKKLSDVINGNWSVKVNGLDGRGHLLYQTIPQNYRFEPGKTYKVSLKYLVGSNGAYQFVIGNGNYYHMDDFIRAVDLKETMSIAEGEKEYKTVTLTFKVPEGEENYWVGMYSTRNAADTQGKSGKDASFGGYKDLIVDDLRIEELDHDVEISKSKLQEAVDTAEKELAKDIYTEASKNNLRRYLDEAKLELNAKETSQEMVDEACNNLIKAIDDLEIEASDKTNLQRAIDEAYGILGSDKYSDEAKQIIRDKLTDADKVNEDSEAKQDQVDKACKDLEEAINAAKVKEGFMNKTTESRRLDPKLIEAIDTSGDAPYDGGATKDKLVDGDRNTFWHNDWSGNNGMPQYVTLKFKEEVTLETVNYVARQSGTNGNVRKYTFQVSDDGNTWKDLVSGEFKNDGTQLNDTRNNRVILNNTKTRYLKFVVTSSFGDANDTFASGAELEFTYLSDKYVKGDEPEVEKTDKTELSKAITEAMKVKLDKKSSQYKADLEKELTRAKAIIADKKASQEAIDKATADLREAIKGLPEKTKDNGLVKIEGKTYYLVDGEKQMGKLIELAGKTYYFDKQTGEMVTGWQEISNKWYYFDQDGNMVKSGWRFAEIKLADGTSKKNWKYFNMYGVNIEKFYNENNNTHLSLVGPNTEYAKGWYKLGRVWIYGEGSWGKLVKSSWRFLEVKLADGTTKRAWKYFNELGYNYSSLYTENGDAYYSLSGPDRYYLKGWKQIGRGWAYFDGPYGERVKDTWRFVEVKLNDGKTKKVWKYFSDKGYNVDNLYRENGYVYYSPKGGNTDYAKGWKEFNGQKYYFWTPSGRAAQGRVYIAGILYNFNDRGVLIK